MFNISFSHIPKDILRQIFDDVDTKSLMAFRCTSKRNNELGITHINNRKKQRLLIEFCRNGNMKGVKRLVSGGTECACMGNSPLIYSVTHGQTHIVHYLLQQPKIDTNFSREFLLVVAIRKKDFMLANILLKRAKKITSPVLLAAKSSQWRVDELLNDGRLNVENDLYEDTIKVVKE